MPEYRKLQIEGIESEISFYGNAGALAEFQDITGLGVTEISTEITKINYGVIYSLMFQAYRVSMLRQKKEVSLSLQDLKLNVSGLKFTEIAALVLSDIYEDCGMKSVEKKTEQPIKK